MSRTQVRKSSKSSKRTKKHNGGGLQDKVTDRLCSKFIERYKILENFSYKLELMVIDFCHNVLTDNNNNIPDIDALKQEIRLLLKNTEVLMKKKNYEFRILNKNKYIYNIEPEDYTTVKKTKQTSYSSYGHE